MYLKPIDGGWLNNLWKAEAGVQTLLIKQYSSKRYNKERLDLLEEALQRQIILEKEGIICPHIYLCDNRAIHFKDDKTAYTVMDFCQGKNINCQTITLAQMQSLGTACALMHIAFSKLPNNTVKGFPIKSKQILDSLWENYDTCKRVMSLNMPMKFQTALLSQKSILMQLTEEFFDTLPKGITHEDFTPDNLLFDSDGVSAIIDFDRNCYSFIYHDIGRAVLSFALEENRLNIEKVHAFLNGYSMHLPLTLSDIADALRISWCIEVVWWVQPECFSMKTCKATRYRDEILWLTEIWFKIESILLR